MVFECRAGGGRGGAVERRTAGHLRYGSVVRRTRIHTGDPDRGGADGLYTNDFGGTSSATPLAAGVAALVLSVNPKLNRDELRSLLRDTADKIGRGYDAKGHSNNYGYGRVNAERAVAAPAAS